uniref:Uncharacterized protein n=1 Tax=Craspedostauros australis TaxID=1486917 RepID=A0A7S0F6Y2_9STRA|mmetsp:Transcript_9709/g.26463  ORF Transcript_9709/g.26463 Transcript_9709/m.26463 type:complete len:148 (+) Transcript_9709:295-738(+)
MKHLSIPSLIFAAIFALSAQNYAGSTLVQAFSVGLGFPRAASCRARATRNEMAFGVGITATTRATTTGTSTTLNGGTKIVSLDFATDLLDEAEDVFESLEVRQSLLWTLALVWTKRTWRFAASMNSKVKVVDMTAICPSGWICGRRC